MRRLLKVPLAVVFAALVGCGDDEPTTTSPGPDGVISTTMVEQLDTAAWKIDPFELLEASIQGDTLYMQVGYSGGCLTHDFGLVISTDFMESDPVQTTALLTHDSKDDACDAWILTWLLADLSPLKAEWQAAYQSVSGTIVLHLDVPVTQAECDNTPFSGSSRCSLLYDF